MYGYLAVLSSFIDQNLIVFNTQSYNSLLIKSKNKLGLWKVDNPVPPWNWKHVENEEGIFNHK
jgi:hypothetical protein